MRRARSSQSRGFPREYMHDTVATIMVGSPESSIAVASRRIFSIFSLTCVSFSMYVSVCGM